MRRTGVLLAVLFLLVLFCALGTFLGARQSSIRWERESTRQSLSAVAQMIASGSPTVAEARSYEDHMPYKDIWGRALRFRVGDDGRGELRSAGPDGHFDDSDDIVVPVPLRK